jgi:hypothetical protein
MGIEVVAENLKGSSTSVFFARIMFFELLPKDSF